MAREQAAFDNSSISPFVKKCVGQIVLPKNAVVLDMPCGYGRHALWLGERGCRVVAADLDRQRVSETQSEYARKMPAARIGCLVADCEFELPFPPAIFEMVLVVHYYSDQVIGRVSETIKPGGHLILETFGAHGQNWRSLPKSGIVAETLKRGHEIIHLTERLAGPNRDHATVRAFTRKLESQ